MVSETCANLTGLALGSLKSTMDKDSQNTQLKIAITLHAHAK